MSNSKLSTIFIMLVGVQIVSAFLFAISSDGFYTISAGNIFKCRELLSSGGDDEVVMLVFVALVFSAILRLVRAGKKSSIGEAFVFFVIFGAGLWIALQGSDCGGFGTTMIERRDPYLLTFSASSLLSAITMINLTLRR